MGLIVMDFKIYSLQPITSCIQKFFAVGDEIEIDFTKIYANIPNTDDKEIAEVTKTDCDVMYAKLKDGRIIGLSNCGTAVRLLKPTKLKVTRVPCYMEIRKNAQQKLFRYPFGPSIPGTKY